MRFIKFLISVIVILAVVFVVGGFVIPAKWTVSRSITVSASPEKIYPYISNFKMWEKWSPWNASMDPTLKYSYSGPKTGVGSKQTWTSEKMGTGWMQFTAADPQTGVSYDLFIDMQGNQSTLHGNISFTPKGQETTVTWTDNGDSGDRFVHRWVGLLIKFMLEKEFDNGLNKLKSLVEQ